jgi:probable F420-dependent oxidoreductase
VDVYATMDPRLPPREVAAHAQRAERLSYTGLHVPEAVHDGLLAAALALEHTTSLRIATCVALAFPRSPTIMAHAAWDLQALSGGRFELGLGTQVKANLEGRFGVPWSAPVPRMRDYVGAVRALWRCWQEGARLDYASAHYRLDRMQPFFDPGPIEHPGIPVLLGGVGPGMTRLAGALADGLVTHPTNASPRFLRERTWPEVRRGAGEAGRALDGFALVAGGFVATGPTPSEVRAERERIRGYLGFLYSTPQYGPSLALHGWDELGPRLRALGREERWEAMPGLVPDALLDALVPDAPYAEIADLLGEWYGGLCTGITFPVPADPAHDAEARRAVERLRARPAAPGAPTWPGR